MVHQRPVGTQGAQFSGSTLGYYQVQVSFDVYTTTDSEANLQVQYTTDGSNYLNAAITSAGSGVISVNSDPSNTNTVLGSYIQLATGWNDQITVNLTGFSSVDNNPKFSIRIVNASKGANRLNTLGSAYNNLPAIGRSTTSRFRASQSTLSTCGRSKVNQQRYNHHQSGSRSRRRHQCRQGLLLRFYLQLRRRR